MGTNEKYEAAMHGYVPSTEQIRNCYGQRWYEQTEKQSDAEFDRWLETVRAEAKAEALTDVAHVLEADIPGHAHENGQIIAGRNIIRIIRARANQYKEAPDA